jgi:NADH:ubiquinone oxidoreductase subunit E
VRNIAHFEDVDELGKVQLSEEDSQVLEQILAGHEAERAAVISVLQDINARYRYLPENILRHTARALDIPLSRVYSIATFYNSFSLTPRGKYVVRVCMGTACHVKGGHQILQALERMLKIASGGTTEDKLFSLEDVRCLGCCGLAPVITINEDLYGSVTQTKLGKILERYQDESVVAESTVGGARGRRTRQSNRPYGYMRYFRRGQKDYEHAAWHNRAAANPGRHPDHIRVRRPLQPRAYDDRRTERAGAR